MSRALKKEKKEKKKRFNYRLIKKQIKEKSKSHFEALN